jgi:phenylalanyl-tRNA synthetase beta chain
VVSAGAVPKTDHLQQCLVNIGEYDYPEKNEAGYVQVICGAPNCHAGMMAIIALPGSELPGYTIGKAKIRVWNRTECSARKRNWAFPTIMPESSSFLRTAIGISVNDLYDLPDTIFELEITPNRPDLLVIWHRQRPFRKVIPSTYHARHQN